MSAKPTAAESAAIYGKAQEEIDAMRRTEELEIDARTDILKVAADATVAAEDAAYLRSIAGIKFSETPAARTTRREEEAPKQLAASTTHTQRK